MTAWVVESLSFFRDDRLNFRVNYPEPFHGINCRFGMRGVVQVMTKEYTHASLLLNRFFSPIFRGGHALT